MLHVVGDAAAMIALPALRRRPAVVGTHGLHLLRRASGPRGRAGARADARRCSAPRGPWCAPRRPSATSSAALDPEAPLARGGERDAAAARRTRGTREAARAALGLADGAGGGALPGPARGAQAPAGRRGRRRARGRGGSPARAARGRRGAAVGRGGRARRARPCGRSASATTRTPCSRPRTCWCSPPSARASRCRCSRRWRTAARWWSRTGPATRTPRATAGLVVPVGDVDALAAAMSRLAGDRAERARLGALGRRRVLTRVLDRALPGVDGRRFSASCW